MDLISLKVKQKIATVSSPKSLPENLHLQNRNCTTVILGDSIVKNVYGNIIPKSVKRCCQIFFWAKIAYLNDYKKNLTSMFCI